MSTTPFHYSEVPAAIVRKIENLQRESHRDIDAITQQVVAKQREHSEVGRSICFEDASALIRQSLRSLLASRREKIFSAAGRAMLLSSHAETSSWSHNAGGGMQASLRDKKPLNIIDQGGDALDVLALIWGEAEIEAFASAAANAAGAKPSPHGLTVSEAVSRSAALVSEVAELAEARQAAVEAMNDLGSVTLSQFIRRADPAQGGAGGSQ